MNAKFTLAIIALVGIGVFALPSTMSLFAGQHSFYNIDATGNQVPCQKCHGDVKAELVSNINTNPANGPLTDGPHAKFKCEYCHRIEQGSASGDNAFGRIAYYSGPNGTGVRTRYAIMSVADFEAGNYPAVINGSDVFINNVTLAGVTLQHGKGVISAADANATNYIGPKSSHRIMLTYSGITGLPLDQNPLTQNGGLDISKATVSSTGSVNLNNSGSKAVNPGSKYHAASLVSCMECHGGEEPLGHYRRVESEDGTVPCNNCHYGGGAAPNQGAIMNTLEAGGFGLTGKADDTGSEEAHNAWVQTDDGLNRFGGANGAANNGACIGCHTHVAVDISFNKGYKLAFTATESATGTYSVSDTKVEGTVHVDIYGNGSGATFGVGDKSYTWTPTTTLYVNGDGAQITGLSGESSDSEAALTN
ncbi:MAG: hypothetical protein WA144_13850 [Candidatus Methanoperedens sp.]